MAYSQYRSVTIDHTKCGTADSTNFPALFSGVYDGTGGILDLRTVGNGGKVQSSSGYDIAFFSDSGLTTALKFERAVWNGSTGNCEFWVKIPTLSKTTDTVIYIAYGDASISTDQQDKVNTWTGYGTVLHCSEDPSGSAPQITDSLGNNHLTAQVGGFSSSDLQTGAFAGGTLGKSVHTGGSNYFEKSTSTTGLPTGISARTLSIWLNLSTTAGIAYGSPISYGSTVAVQNTCALGADGANKWALVVYGANYSSTIALQTGWHLLHMSIDGSGNVAFYKDGAAGGTTSDGSLNTVLNYFDMGKINWGEILPASNFDEARVASTNVSSSWVTSEYNNQSSPSTFYTLGSETPAGAAGQFLSPNSKYL